MKQVAFTDQSDHVALRIDDRHPAYTGFNHTPRGFRNRRIWINREHTAGHHICSFHDWSPGQVVGSFLAAIAHSGKVFSCQRSFVPLWSSAARLLSSSRKANQWGQHRAVLSGEEVPLRVHRLWGSPRPVVSISDAFLSVFLFEAVCSLSGYWEGSSVLGDNGPFQASVALDRR
jgi:hypothetical protein